MHDEQGHDRRNVPVTDTNIWTSTPYTMLLDFCAHFDVYVGPCDSFLEGLCHMNDWLAHLIQNTFHTCILGGSVAILDNVVQNKCFGPGRPNGSPWTSWYQSQGLTPTNDPGSKPYLRSRYSYVLVCKITMLCILLHGRSER